MKKLLGYLLVIVGIVIMVDSKLEMFNIPFPKLIGGVVAAVGLGLSAMGGEDSYARFKEQYEAETGEQLGIVEPAMPEGPIPCPHCGQMIQPDALKCRHCDRTFSTGNALDTDPVPAYRHNSFRMHLVARPIKWYDFGDGSLRLKRYRPQTIDVADGIFSITTRTGEQLSCPLSDLEVVWSDKDGNRWWRFIHNGEKIYILGCGTLLGAYSEDENFFDYLHRFLEANVANFHLPKGQKALDKAQKAIDMVSKFTG